MRICPSASQRGFGLVDGLLLFAIIALAAIIIVPYTISSEQDEEILDCVVNLHEFEDAIQMWRLRNGKGPNDAVTIEDVRDLVGAGATNCPAGGQYQIIRYGGKYWPACTVPGHALHN